jgi:hypothetical protein
MIKITGLEQLSRDLEEAKKAMSAMDSELVSVSCDPQDPASIEAAIQEVERLIDERLGSYETNPIVGPLVAAMKEQHRQHIIDMAAEARTAEDDSSGE